MDSESERGKGNTPKVIPLHIVDEERAVVEFLESSLLPDEAWLALV